MTEYIGLALLAFSSLLAMVDPLGSVPVYVASTSRLPPAQRSAILRQAVLTAFLVLLAFGLLGSWIFQVFGITTEAFRITGGIILFGVGLDMLRAQRSRVRSTEEEEEEGIEKQDIGIVPLGIPLLAGPGAITSMITLLAQAEDVTGRVIVYVVMAGVLGIAWAVLRVAPVIARRLGTTGMNIVERLMGLIVMVIGVQLVLDGISDAVMQTMQRLERPGGG